MRRLRISLSLLVCLLLIGMTNRVSAQERDIYIGDLITLSIPTKAVGEEELRKAFEAFEIVDLHETKEGYTLKFRSFEPGEKKVVIGNQEIIISVQSTLKEMNTAEIFEGDLTPRSGNVPIKWVLIYALVLFIFVTSGIIYVINFLKKRKVKVLTSYEKFLSAIEKVQVTSPSSLVEMTIIFKNYLEDLFDRRIIGKTSEEMLLELALIPETSPQQEIIRNWLKACDALKFNGGVIKKEERDKLLQELKQLGATIHEPIEVKVG